MTRRSDIVKTGLKPTATRTAKSALGISHALHNIEENLQNPRPASELSQIAAIPKRHFRKLFRQEAGATPYQYLLQTRAKQAASLVLSEPDLDLGEVASRVGFSSAGALKRKFKLVFGVAIEDYRRVARQG